jgi:hypothetical protein
MVANGEESVAVRGMETYCPALLVCGPGLAIVTRLIIRYVTDAKVENP